MNPMFAFIGLPELLLVLLVFPFTLAIFAFWVWMLVHAIQNRGLTDSERIVWVIVIVFLHVLGALLYLLIGRPKANQAPAPPAQA
jgi:uncharacterized membrane protein YidH (DUF202 family)